MRKIGVLAALLLVCAGCGGGSSTSQKTVTVGAWGRDAPTRVELDVTTTGATLRDSSSSNVGFLSGPIKIEGNGHFSEEGYVGDGEGPPPVPGARPRGEWAVRFSGAVSGNTMTISYTPVGGGDTTGPFTLTYVKDESL